MLKKAIWGMIAVVLVVIAIMQFQPVGEKINPLTYFDEFKKNTNNLVYNDTRIDLEEPAKLIDGEIYVSYEFARNFVSDTIFYDYDEKVMTLTTVRDILKLYEGSGKALLNFEEVPNEYIIQEKDGILYVPATLLRERFGVEVQMGEDGRLFVASNLTEASKTAIIKKKTSLQTHPQKKSKVVDTLIKGEKVNVYDEENGFARVRCEDGMIGYVPVSSLKNQETVAAQPIDEVEVWPSNPLNDKVKLVWDQLTVSTEGKWDTTKYTDIKNANVISPTWFEFGDENGQLVDRGNKAYVENAHARGLQVWPILSHSFENTKLTKIILSSTAKRQYVIDQIIEKAQIYGFDGINIDIENIQVETSDVWVQFMRELYPQLKKNNIIVSVDVYMPSNWSNHYEREAVAKASDYFMVMAYDQHWSGSEVAGSVSEIPWVEEGIMRNLEEVPADKLVLGIPFYTRLWKEGPEGLSSTPYGMNGAANLVKEWGVTPILDEVSGQLYAELQKEGATYKIWLENKESIQKRIDLMNKYNLAGYGGWKLGLETADVWDVLGQIE